MRKRWKKFVEEYLRSWNATEAAKKAGYSERTAYSQGPRLLKNVEVELEIQRRLKEMEMQTDEVLVRLTEQARNLGASYLTTTFWHIDLARLIQDGKQHLIKKLDYDSRSNIIVEFYDAQHALELIGKHHKLFQTDLEEAAPRLLEDFETVMAKIWLHFYGKSEQGRDSVHDSSDPGGLPTGSDSELPKG